MRVGINQGPVIAGVIGRRQFLFDLWGDTVNVASRMERTGPPGRVHISTEVRVALGDAYAAEALPAINVKGKGLMETFLLS